MSADRWAEEYRRCGWSLVPVPAGQKGTFQEGWQTREFGPADFPPGCNVAMLLGPRSGNTVDVDLDCPEALALADVYLPPTGAQFGRAAKPRSHRLYVAPGALFESFADPIGQRTLIELRTRGVTGGEHLTLLPPSVADGERREWEGNTIEPAIFDAAKLHRRCAYLAIGCLIRRYVSEYRPNGRRPTCPTSSTRPNPSLAAPLTDGSECPTLTRHSGSQSDGATTAKPKSTSPTWLTPSRMIATGTAGTASAWRSSRHPAARTKAASSSMPGAPSHQPTTLTRRWHVGGIGTIAAVATHYRNADLPCSASRVAAASL